MASTAVSMPLDSLAGCQFTATPPTETKGTHASICDGPPESNSNDTSPYSYRVTDRSNGSYHTIPYHTILQHTIRWQISPSAAWRARPYSPGAAMMTQREPMLLLLTFPNTLSLPLSSSGFCQTQAIKSITAWCLRIIYYGVYYRNSNNNWIFISMYCMNVCMYSQNDLYILWYTHYDTVPYPVI